MTSTCKHKITYSRVLICTYTATNKLARKLGFGTVLVVIAFTVIIYLLYMLRNGDGEEHFNMFGYFAWNSTEKR